MTTKKPLIINGIGMQYLATNYYTMVDDKLCSKQCIYYGDCLASRGFTIPICRSYKEAQ